jgi:hypothetical protein
LGGENGIKIGFKSFSFTLRQGEFVHTDIAGSLTIPGFGNNTKIDVAVSFDKDGNFKITAPIEQLCELPALCQPL